MNQFAARVRSRIRNDLPLGMRFQLILSLVMFHFRRRSDYSEEIIWLSLEQEIGQSCLALFGFALASKNNHLHLEYSSIQRKPF